MVSKACCQARAFQSLPEQRKVYRSIVSNIFKCSYYLQIVMCLMFVWKSYKLAREYLFGKKES